MHKTPCPDPQATGRIVYDDPSRRAGDTRTASDADDVDNPCDVEHDRVWEGLLMQLLGRLESGRTALVDQSCRRDPARAVRVAVAVVYELSRFGTRYLDPQAFAHPLAQVTADAGRFVTAAGVAAVPSPRKWFGLVADGTGQAAKRDECVWVLNDFPLVLERFFTLFGGGFRLTAPALRWVDTSGLLLTEIKLALLGPPAAGRTSSF